MSKAEGLIEYTGGAVETNAFLLPCKEEGTYLAIDAPEGFAGFIQSGGYRVKALLLTHGHYDHVWDSALIAQQAGCPIYAHPLDHGMILQPTYLRMFGIPKDYPQIKALESLEVPRHGTVEWACGGHSFHVSHVPGHCPGSLNFYLEPQEIVFGGDVLFAGGVGRWDFPGCSRVELLESIRSKFLTLPDSTVVYPGHGPQTTIGVERKSNPYLR